MIDNEVLMEAPPEEITDGIEQLFGITCGATSHLLQFLRVADDRDLWGDDGAASMEAWVAVRLGIAHRSAARLVRVARALKDLPLIALALERGEISLDKADVLVRLATKDTEATLLEEAKGLSVAQLEAAARDKRIVEERSSEAHRRRALRYYWTHDDSVLHLKGRLPAEHGAKLVKALEVTVATIPAVPDSPYDALCADALVEMASTALGVGADRDPDRATVIVQVDAGALGAGDGAAELDGIPIAAETARRLCCDARVQLAATHGGRTIGVGRTRRTVPRWLARHLRARDKCCRFPGCRRRARLQAHHVRHWPQGGRTDLDELLCLCWYHHRLVHEGGWSIRGDPDFDVVFIRPDGRPYEPNPPPLREDIAARLLPSRGRPAGWTLGSPEDEPKSA
jgi:hypothetical protein